MNGNARSLLWVASVCGAFLLRSIPAIGQDCPAGMVAYGDEVKSWLEQVTRELNEPALEAGFDQAQKAARLEDGTKVTAPSDSSAGTSIVDHAFLPSLLGLAIENGLVSSKDQVTTVNLNLFAFLSVANPSVVSDQEQYLTFGNLRRVGGSVSFGGKGEKLDQDGDGTPDDPLEAKEAGDIVNYEVSYRLWGSRDPRDQQNFDSIVSAFQPDQVQFHNEKDILERQASDALNPDNAGCVAQSAWQAYRADPTAEAQVKTAAAALIQTLARRDAAVKAVTEGPIWSLVVGGVQQKTKFGPDKIKVALRGELGKSTLNFEWMKIDSLTGTSDPTMYKGGYQYNSTWFKGEKFPGIGASASATYEHYQDCPEAMHDTIAKAQLKLEVPWSQSIKIPISVSWANHKDLLTDERDIRGHIGFTFDYSKLIDLLKDTNVAQVAAKRMAQ